MSIPLFLPIPTYVSRIRSGRFVPLKHWCRRAGLACKASGRFVERPIALKRCQCPAILVEAAPFHRVQIGVPHNWTAISAARYVMAALAFALMDVVARQSIAGAVWAKPTAKVGRPKTGRARNNRERQRRLRSRTRC